MYIFRFAALAAVIGSTLVLQGCHDPVRNDDHYHGYTYNNYLWDHRYDNRYRNWRNYNHDDRRHHDWRNKHHDHNDDPITDDADPRRYDGRSYGDYRYGHDTNNHWTREDPGFTGF